ncbi:MAG: hypothetical protein A2599_00330 [Candidatus Staskawiczbacteria bacterium RIFOXYD1_FULL_39_28]|uniref:Uncharacterized protein n=1 Tax=Candidatus Staskawiczbacteria bacterium RIFOXYC1_FULL_38_18 TaxID=1802229 RepID=A0A1G2JFM2_9BACT|nr:MAG: hypothetical protein A2401_03045 [Candidatus Staskawiczbacteria bacterium RIFOXYC1_FULL_38_18]OGZ90385.1 MAG: hypothetical protein A2599_00330 [Candidatus Staskawiczbacteria bacterium RIFOXYD1_FULL_39_28]
MVDKCQKIIIPTRPHADVIVGIFLLIKFGQKLYSGVKDALVEIWQELPVGDTSLSLEEKGVLLLDVGGGKFDHHNTGKNLAQLIAENLEISTNPTIAKLLAYAERDDKHGLGTLSNDPLDKAFGLSGLIASLNKTVENPKIVIESILPLLEAHLTEEKRRVEELPQEFEKKLNNGQAEVFEIKQSGKNLKVVVLESDNLSMAGWIKSSIGLKADVVCQKKSSGFVNILTKPFKKVDLRWTAAYLRSAECELKDIKTKYSTFDLMSHGKLPEISEWYYDNATNSVLNGGASPKGILPTTIPLETIKNILKESLSQELPRQTS